MKTILILSTGRVGSKFLIRLFSESFSNLEAHHGGPYSRFFNVLGNMCLANLLPNRMVGKVYSQMIGRVVRRCPAEFYLDANAYVVGLLPYLDKAYPNLKIVHLVRDPRDVVRSYINWIHTRPASWLAHHFIPFWQPKPSLTALGSWTKLLSEELFDRLAWVWALKNSKFMELSEFEVPYHMVRFEDLFAVPNGKVEFVRLLEFMGLPSVDIPGNRLDQKINQTTKKNFPHWTEWSPDLCAHLTSICGTAMIRYGYGNEQEWLEQLRKAEGSKSK